MLPKSGHGQELTDLVKHLVALVENERLDVAKGKLLVSNESIQTTRCGDDDVGISLLVGQDFDVLRHGSTTVEDGGLDVGQVLAETRVFVLDLVRQLTSVAHDEDRALASNRLQLMKSGEDEDSSLTETGLGLAKHVDVEHGGWDTDLLDCGLESER